MVQARHTPGLQLLASGQRCEVQFMLHALFSSEADSTNVQPFHNSHDGTAQRSGAQRAQRPHL